MDENWQPVWKSPAYSDEVRVSPHRLHRAVITDEELELGLYALGISDRLDEKEAHGGSLD